MSENPAIVWWLRIVALFVVATLVVGGATRITDFGPLDHRVEAAARRHSAADREGLAGCARDVPADPRVPAHQQGHEPRRIPDDLSVGMGAPAGGADHRPRLSPAVHRVLAARDAAGLVQAVGRAPPRAWRPAGLRRLVDGDVGADGARRREPLPARGSPQHRLHHPLVHGVAVGAARGPCGAQRGAACGAGNGCRAAVRAPRPDRARRAGRRPRRGACQRHVADDGRKARAGRAPRHHPGMAQHLRKPADGAVRPPDGRLRCAAACPGPCRARMARTRQRRARQPKAAGEPGACADRRAGAVGDHGGASSGAAGACRGASGDCGDHALGRCRACGAPCRARRVQLPWRPCPPASPGRPAARARCPR